MPKESEISRKMSRDFKKLGMAFVGPVITYSFMQAIGMVNDHLLDCSCRFPTPSEQSGSEDGKQQYDK